MTKRATVMGENALNVKARLILIVLAIAMIAAFGLALGSSQAVTVSAQSQDEPAPRPDSTIAAFSNPAIITINDNTTASPYPSTITVSGVNPAYMYNLRVTLTGLTHTFPDDIDIMLVGPQGQRSILMSDAGGGGDVTFLGPIGFEQAAANPIPDSTTLTPGLYRPANYTDTADSFPTLDPPASTMEPADLSVFNGTDPNGDWKLYIVDDAADDSGSLFQGWSLRFTVPTGFTVTKTADTNDGVCNADCSLREAIAAAPDGELINFSSLFSTPQTITLGGTELAINKSLYIQGPGANLLTVSANSASRILNIGSAIVNISGMTITGGSLGSFSSGGGIVNGGALTISGCVITGNTGAFGGGIDNNNALTILNSTVSNNTATATNGISTGGGIDDNNGGSMIITNSTISGNVAANGPNSGGGISSVSHPIITNTTITNNRAPGAGGIIIAIGTETIRNCIIAGNANNDTVPDVGGAFDPTSAYNIIGNVGTATGFTPANQNQTGTGAARVDPKLGSLQYNGATTPTHAVLAGSPALDAGNRFDSTTDQRGRPRPVDTSGVANISDGSDIGSVEMQIITVLNANDSGTGSLRSAISAANTNGAGLDDIIFDSMFFATQQTISLESALPNITGSVTINGPGWDKLTISGSNTRRIFNTASPIILSISDATLANGFSPDGGDGGAILVTGAGAELDLNRLQVLNCIAPGSGGGVAAGPALNVNISDSLFAGNIGGTAGGLQIRAVSAVTIRNTTLSGNQSQGFLSGGGGGIRFTSLFSGTAAITNSTITANSTGGDGGGIRREGGTVNVRNTIIAGNVDTSSATAPDIFGAFVSKGFSLIGDTTGGSGFTNGVNGDQAGSSGSQIDPLLGPLANNGGTTLTHSLLVSSPALDKGNNFGSGILTDQRGLTRTVDLAGITNASDGTDIGAYEAQTGPVGSPTPTATPTSTFTATPTSTPTATPTSTPCGGTFSYTGPTVPITDNVPAGVNFTIPVSGGGSISDVNFRFDGTQSADPASTTPGVNHSFVGDLVVKITSPAGTTVAAFDRPGVPATSFGCNSNNLAQIVLDDDGGFPAVEGQCATDTTAFPTGSFSPNSALSAFDGQNPNGNWTINISDNAGTDTGSARAFSLIIGSACSTPTNTPTSTPTGAGTPAITGTVTYGNAISGPTPPRFVSNVTINGTGSPNVSTTTAAPGTTAGQYSLTGFGAGPYTVAPTKTGGVNNITSFDAARIAQHVSGGSLLTGNALVVADVSGNNSITSFDAANIANYVVVASPAGSSGTWRFYTTPNVPFPPGATATSRTYPSVTTSITGQDYTGLLMGEVSGNWNNTGARTVGSRQRQSAAAGDIVTDSGRGIPERSAAVAAPQMVTPADHDVIIPVSVDGVAAEKGIISYEFDLRYDPSVIQPQEDPVDIAGTVSRGLSVAVNPKEAGLLRVALYGPMPLDGNGVLLNLRFTAIGAPGSVSPLTWERLMFNEGDPQTTVADGRVELSAAAANQAEISGRLLTATGQGVPIAHVTLTDTAGQSRSILSNAFGVYRFGNLQVGQTYTISVDSKRYAFTPLTVSVTDQLVGVDMIAEP